MAPDYQAIVAGLQEDLQAAREGAATYKVMLDQAQERIRTLENALSTVNGLMNTIVQAIHGLEP